MNQRLRVHYLAVILEERDLWVSGGHLLAHGVSQFTTSAVIFFLFLYKYFVYTSKVSHLTLCRHHPLDLVPKWGSLYVDTSHSARLCCYYIPTCIDR